LNFQINLNLFLEWLLAANSLLKIGIFSIVWAIAWLPIAILIAWQLKWNPTRPLTTREKLPLLASLYAIVPFIIWGSAKIDRASFADYGLVWQWRFGLSILAGLSLGIGGLIVVFSIERSLGWMQWQSENLAVARANLLPLLALGLWIGTTEELVFRGYFLELLQKNYSITIAAILSSTIFALLHLVWEREQTIPQLPGLWLMGMLLVGARLFDNGSLGLACGLHAGWIWGLSTIDSAQLLVYTGKGSAWITGIGGQPLAGIAGIVCLVGTGAILGVMTLL
jgi:uncharacterized protein